jgi:hypothetical protein
MDLKDMITTATDITGEALKYIEREGRYGSEGDVQSCWLTLLFDAEGDFLTGGVGRTAPQAAAVAWVWTWHPCGDETWGRVMPELSIRAPSEQLSCVLRFVLGDGAKPDDYRLELFPPGTWEARSPEWDQAWENEGLPASWVERRREALQRGLQRAAR